MAEILDKIRLQPVLLLVGPDGLAQRLDHGVDVVLQLGDDSFIGALYLVPPLSCGLHLMTSRRNALAFADGAARGTGAAWP